MKIKEIYKIKPSGKRVRVKGWVEFVRGNKKICFVEVNDGSNFKNIQAVVKKDAETFLDIQIGTPISISGQIKLTPNSKQSLELVVDSVEILGEIANNYPIQKKEMSLEKMREFPHLRHKTKLMRALMMLRSSLAHEIHGFFRENNFLYFNAPILTSVDAEGSGEVFGIVDSVDDDFFAKQSFLSVTGQLHAETYANGFGNVYTFGPAFRAEKSHTPRHAAEFWMIEPEMAFYELDEAIDLAVNFIKSVIKNLLEKEYEIFDYLDKKVDLDLINLLNSVVEDDFVKITYKEAIDILKQNAKEFDGEKVEFGIDLSTVHEKFLTDKHFKKPLIVVDYPTEIKAFYMKRNDDQKTVKAFDLLVPGVGEIIGGSEREDLLDKIVERAAEVGVEKDKIQWYLDIRKYGASKSSGFGLGLERLLMYISGIQNIRDVIPYPRTHKNLKM